MLRINRAQNCPFTGLPGLRIIRAADHPGSPGSQLYGIWIARDPDCPRPGLTGTRISQDRDYPRSRFSTIPIFRDPN